MKWTWDTTEQKRVKYRKRMEGWQRKFCLWPRRDYPNQTTYWMQFVWRRVTRWCSDDIHYGSCTIAQRWEYRDGNRRAPDMTKCPAHLTPSVVQPTSEPDELFVPDAAKAKPNGWKGEYP